MRKILQVLFISGFLFFWGCGHNKLPQKRNESTLPFPVEKTGAVKFINNCDFECNAILPDSAANSGNGTIIFQVDEIVKKEGIASFGYEYKLNGGKSIHIKKNWYDKNRSDLSFHPLGISLWIKGSSANTDRLTISLLQQNEEFSLSNSVLKPFSYVNDTILSENEWTQLVIPYGAFKKDNDALRLDLVAGLKFIITNTTGDKSNHRFYIDDIKQLTSFQPVIKNTARFSSIFIQLHARYHQYYNWRKDFAAYKEVGIDTVIVQYATTHQDNRVFNYAHSKAPWGVIGEYDMIDKIIKEAEKNDLKVILGLNGGRYPLNKGDVFAYDTLYKKHCWVIDELYNKFSDSKAMAGWYINEEFHDGQNRGWWKMSDRMILANYLQKVASYAKAKPKKFLVCIAPALWRGRTASLTGGFYKSILEVTKDIDIMYLQDCGGRCGVEQEDFDVYLL